MFHGFSSSMSQCLLIPPQKIKEKQNQENGTQKPVCESRDRLRENENPKNEK